MQRFRAPAVTAVVAVVGVFALASAVRAATVSVNAEDNAFNPETVEIQAGDTVVWTNTGSNPHTVTASDDSWASGTLQPGETFTWRFTAAGTFTYYCEFHGSADGQGMVGRVTITAAEPDPSPSPSPSPSPTSAPDGPSPRAIDDSCPPARVREDGFADADGTTHEAAIDCVVWWEVAKGTGSGYGPNLAVTREAMATFIANLIVKSGGSLPAAGADRFDDDNSSVHQDNINRLAEAQVVSGTGEGSFTPKALVTREQMATFLVKAYQYRTGTSLTASSDYFSDDDASAHQANINKAAEAGFTGGKPDGSYAPKEAVTRGAMASFLARVLDLLVEEGSATPPA